MKKILVAEDTESNFLLLSIILRRDYEILRAFNGAEAVEICRAEHPDLILMDIKMPVMDGLEATKVIRTFNEEIVIIALTANASTVTVKRHILPDVITIWQSLLWQPNFAK